MPKTNKSGASSSSRKEEGIITRCSALFLRKLMLGDFGKLITAEHREALRATPFYSFLSMDEACSLNLEFMDALIQRFDPEAVAFRLGDDLVIPFDVKEFSVVMGLQFFGRYVGDNSKEPSVALTRIFKEDIKKRSQIDRKKVLEKMEAILKSGNTSVAVLEDLKRLYVALVFITVLFPTSHFSLPLFLHPYFDDIAQIRTYSWGPAVHRFVCSFMRARKEDNTRIVDGCLVGVMAWIFERVPQLGIPNMSSFPHRFVMWKCPGPSAVKSLGGIKSRDIREFGLLPEETFLLEACRPGVDEVDALRAENGRLRGKRLRLEEELASHTREEPTGESSTGSEVAGSADVYLITII